MLTLEMAIQKIHQLPTAQQKQIIEFIEVIVQQTEQASFTEIAQEFVGCLDSDLEDLSHNPQYFKEFGQP